MERIESESVRGVAADTEVATLIATRAPSPNDDTRALIRALGDAGIRTLLVVRAGDDAPLAVVVPADDRDGAVAAWAPVAAARNVTWKEDREAAVVSAIGHAVHSHPGTIARVLDCLAEAGIAVRAVASSAQSVTCLVERDAVPRALTTLHARFGLANGPATPARS